MSGYIGPKSADVPVGTISTKGTISGNNIVIGGATVNSTVFTGTANNTSFVGSVSAANVVSNAQLTANLANYQTTAGLSSNVATLTSNAAVYANGSATNTFTIGTANYFVANGNVGIGNTTPAHRLSIQGTSYFSNSVGIGTTSPSSLLDVVADNQYIQQRTATQAGVSSVWAMDNAFWSTPTYRGIGILHYGSTSNITLLGTTSSNNAGVLIFQNEATGIIYTNGGTPLLFGTTNAERMRIAANGNVGIGVSSPAFKFDLNGGRAQFAPSSEAYAIGLRYNNSTNGVWLGSPSANAFQISNAGGGALFNITGNGNIGINYTNPDTLNARLYCYGYSGFGASNNGAVSLGSRTNWTSTFENYSGGYGLGVNINASSGLTQLQSQRFDGTATAYDIALNSLGGNVAIGSSSATHKLFVFNSSATNTASGAFMGGESIVLSLRSNGANTGASIQISDNSSYVSYIGQVANTGGALAFAPNGTERMRIDANGNIGLNDTPSAWSGIRAIQTSGPGSAIRTSFYSAGATNGGGIVSNAYYDGTNWKYIYGSGFPATRYEIGESGIHQWFTAPSSTGTVTFTERMRVDSSLLTLTNLQGIKFQATQSASSDANTLDDYEEGTWTPAWNTTNNNMSLTYGSTPFGKYTKIGRLVHITGYILTNTISSQGTGQIVITGLPFSVNEEVGICIADGSALRNYLSSTQSMLTGYGQNTTQLRPGVVGSAGNAYGLTTGSLAASSYFLFSATYITST
jgi:hypothetical protein